MTEISSSTGGRVILLIGANGQVGHALERSLQGLGNVVAPTRDLLDLNDLPAVRHAVREVRPAWIVNAAAWTAVEQAESDVAGARRLNAELPEVLAQEAARLGALLVHYSTDYVFDGRQARPYVEDDEAAPLNVYGRTKREGELAIEGAGCAHLILRTSWVYGLRRSNFLLTMLRLASERETLRVVGDQIGAPTWSVTIAEMTAHMLARANEQDGEGWLASQSGIYHLSAAGETSWAGFAREIFRMEGLATQVEEVPSSAYPSVAMRPMNSRLSHDKIVRRFGLRAPDWRAALQLCLAR